MKCPAYHCLKERVVLGVYVAEAGVTSEECNITNSWRLHLLVRFADGGKTEFIHKEGCCNN